jgi:hypothetical protein
MLLSGPGSSGRLRNGMWRIRTHGDQAGGHRTIALIDGLSESISGHFCGFQSGNDSMAPGGMDAYRNIGRSDSSRIMWWNMIVKSVASVIAEVVCESKMKSLAILTRSYLELTVLLEAAQGHSEVTQVRTMWSLFA